MDLHKGRRNFGVFMESNSTIEFDSKIPQNFAWPYLHITFVSHLLSVHVEIIFEFNSRLNRKRFLGD